MRRKSSASIVLAIAATVVFGIDTSVSLADNDIYSPSPFGYQGTDYTLNGIQFTALDDSTLNSFVGINNSSGGYYELGVEEGYGPQNFGLLGSWNFPSTNGRDFVNNIDIPLSTGRTYYLLGGSDEIFMPFTGYPNSDADISATNAVYIDPGTRGSSTTSTSEWVGFTDIDTISDAAAPVTAPATQSQAVSSTSVTVGNTAVPGAVQATFASQSVGGNLTVTSGVDTTSDLQSSGNSYGAGAIDFNLPVAGSSVQIWDISDSLGEPSAPVTLTFTFDPTGMTSQEIAGLEIEHYVNGNWDEITPSLISGDEITFTTSSFSPFALGEEVVPEPASLSLLVIGAGGLLMRRRRTTG